MEFSEQLKIYAETHFENRKKYFAPILSEIEAGLSLCSEEEALLIKFFYGTMPLRDAGEYPFEIFLSYVRHALWLRKTIDWCKKLPEDLFVHDVLYYRINSEDISDCRSFFYEQLKDRIVGLDEYQAAVEINYWCAEHATYEMADDRTAGPMTMYRSGKGRCGEESTFTVTALRSVGLAARQVYTPRWAHCDDNHAWVEVWVNGEWHFLGACEPEEKLDRGWFTGPAGQALLIHSRTFGDYAAGKREEVIGRDGAVVCHNVTASYTKTRKLRIQVRKQDNTPAAHAQVSVEILNMAEYFPAAVLETDEQGGTSIRLGLGDIRLQARSEGKFVERYCNLAEDGVGAADADCAVTLVLKDSEAGMKDALSGVSACEWHLAKLCAPKEVVVRESVLSEEEVSRGTRRLADAVKLREERFDQLTRHAIAVHPEEEERMRVAGENAEELTAFLEKDDNPDRKELLDSLTKKDNKDLRAEVLEDHLSAKRGSWSEDIHVQDLLCPRIWLEEIGAYRSYICSVLTAQEQEAFASNPELIWNYVNQNITDIPEEEYNTLCASPIGCLKLKMGSAVSRTILFIAICRSLNIPARLDKSLMLPEYWADGAFRVPVSRAQASKGTLLLRNILGKEWIYAQHWTLGRLEKDHFVTMNHAGLVFEKETLELFLPVGIYRLIAVKRLLNGDQEAAELLFAIEKEKQTELYMPDFEKTDGVMPWEKNSVPDESQSCRKLQNKNNSLREEIQSCLLRDILFQRADGTLCSLEKLVSGKRSILAFLEIGAEPTEHVLNEVLALEKSAKGNSKGIGCQLLFVLRQEKDLQHKTLQEVLALDAGSEIEILYDISGGASDANAAPRTATGDTASGTLCGWQETAKRMRLAEKLPVLAAVRPDGTGIYGSCGYHVGSVELMVRILKEAVRTEAD
ncbi:transglutaminase domain-containing protein [Gallintestinimicrobium sp.]|uniref:transglutaminase domain-containing protein n=1 Tax=Gallintestinimicrobium sp. TaxID=2981655 RepID=UPI003AF113C6